jgi:hypothetical protein
MTSFGKKSITYLGTLHGEGTLLTGEGRPLGLVTYEIDSYRDHCARSATGQIEAASRILNEAFQAKDATIVLNNGRCVHIIVSDPGGSATAEVRVTGSFPF